MKQLKQTYNLGQCSLGNRAKWNEMMKQIHVQFFINPFLFSNEMNKIYKKTLKQDETDQNIMKTRLFKYIENFTSKNWKFSDKKLLLFFIFLLKT